MRCPTTGAPGAPQAEEDCLPLYRITCTKQGGSRCYSRAMAVAVPITRAVQKLWGTQCSWAWVPGSDTEGRVSER